MLLSPVLKLKSDMFAQYVGVNWHRIFVMLVDFIKDIGTYDPPKNPSIMIKILITLDAVLLSLNIILIDTPSTELKVINDINTMNMSSKFSPQFILRNTVLTKYIINT